MEHREIAPTERDLRNERLRFDVAARLEARYMECWQWAAELFGSDDWEPSGKHSLVDKEEEDRCRGTGEFPKAAATVYTVRRGKEKRHFFIQDGRPVECENYEAAFREMFAEMHPTQRIEVRGERVAPYRYSLHWAGFELYRPRSATELAEMRIRREQRKIEKAERKWVEENPLFADGVADR